MNGFAELGQVDIGLLRKEQGQRTGEAGASQLYLHLPSRAAVVARRALSDLGSGAGLGFGGRTPHRGCANLLAANPRSSTRASALSCPAGFV